MPYRIIKTIMAIHVLWLRDIHVYPQALVHLLN